MAFSAGDRSARYVESRFLLTRSAAQFADLSSWFFLWASVVEGYRFLPVRDVGTHHQPPFPLRRCNTMKIITARVSTYIFAIFEEGLWTEVCVA